MVIQNFLEPKPYRTQNDYWTQIFSDHKFFWSNIFFLPKIFFWPKLFFGPKVLSDQKFFWDPKIFSDTKFFSDQNFFSNLKVFRTQNFFGPKFLDPKFRDYPPPPPPTIYVTLSQVEGWGRKFKKKQSLFKLNTSNPILIYILISSREFQPANFPIKYLREAIKKLPNFGHCPNLRWPHPH